MRPREVLQRHPAGALGDEPLETPGRGGVEVGAQEQPALDLAAPHVEDVGEEQDRVGAGGGDARRGELGLGRAQEVAQRTAHPSRAASWAASSAATAESTTASRSPSSTLSRLCALKPVRWSEIRFSGKL